MKQVINAKLLTWLMLISFATIYINQLSAESNPIPHTVTITGECLVANSGRLFIYLVDSKQFTTPMTGIKTIEIAIQSPPGQTVSAPFSFQVQKGQYGLRCFLDTNHNGLLDKGLFGPSEPWAMSWQKKRPLGFPSFTDIAFNVDTDYPCPALKLE